MQEADPPGHHDSLVLWGLGLLTAEELVLVQGRIQAMHQSTGIEPQVAAQQSTVSIPQATSWPEDVVSNYLRKASTLFIPENSVYPVRQSSSVVLLADRYPVPPGLPLPSKSCEWHPLDSSAQLFWAVDLEGGVGQLCFYNATGSTHFIVSALPCCGRIPSASTVQGREGRIDAVVHPGETLALFSSPEPTIDDISVSVVDTSLPPKGPYKEYLAAKRAGAEAKLADEILRIREACAEEGIDPEDTACQKAVVRLCLERKVRYVDLSFPPSRGSLGGRAQSSWAGWTWLRPKDFLVATAKPALFVADLGDPVPIRPADIHQGRMGDCWLLSALAALAETPDLIRRIFTGPLEEREERKAGAWTLRICKDGWWREVVVDDYLPCDGLEPVYASNSRKKNELWPCLVEKGFAKLCGSYKAVEEPPGDPMEAFSDMTGYTFDRFPDWWRFTSVFFGSLLEYTEAGYAMTIHTFDADPPMLPKGAYWKAGLVKSHAYSLVHAVRVRADDGRVLDLCLIRNSQTSRRVWRGPWGEGSGLWEENPGLKRKLCCGADLRAEGLFWMAFEDVQRWFEGGGVCYVTPGWQCLRARMTWYQAPSHFLEVHVHEPSAASISLHQTDRRVTKKPYHPFMVAVLHPVPGGMWAVAQVGDPLNRGGGKSHPDHTGCGRYWRGKTCHLDYNFSCTDDGRPYYIIWSVHPDPQVDLSACDTVVAPSFPISISLHSERPFATVRFVTPGRYGSFLSQPNGTCTAFTVGDTMAVPVQTDMENRIASVVDLRDVSKRD
eukprot:Sspe_Gene.59909::Locus_32947_Transcript_1_1_Confidence_1.000_Length_2428::g.59909::m.59909/K08582/CAPN15; calpain-15